MCLLLESIKIHNKQLCNIEFHNSRFNKARQELFDIEEVMDIKTLVNIPPNLDYLTYKCRIVYDIEIRSIEFIPYKKKKIRSLRLMRNDSIEYNYKYFDRKIFEQMLQNPGADEILIVKNGKITDTSYSNIVLFDGQKWVTPSEPLLKGTKREYLLFTGQITEEEINVDDIRLFKCAKLINAMLDIEDQEPIKISKIFDISYK